MLTISQKFPTEFNPEKSDILQKYLLLFRDRWSQTVHCCPAAISPISKVSLYRCNRNNINKPEMLI